jgi:catechol 2,3-dioxygenase-like lactoylglutathione lyase family enzyme
MRPKDQSQSRNLKEYVNQESEMNRFHVHVAVDDLEANVRFYSAMFGTEPSVRRDDYAKWMLDDPLINFAISKRSRRPGINHLGIQVESDADLDAMRRRLTEAEIAATTPGETACCYAHSKKYWTTDPQGIAWETFHSLHSIPVYGEDRGPETVHAASACCISDPPQITQALASSVATKQSACCP